MARALCSEGFLVREESEAELPEDAPSLSRRGAGALGESEEAGPTSAVGAPPSRVPRKRVRTHGYMAPAFGLPRLIVPEGQHHT